MSTTFLCPEVDRSWEDAREPLKEISDEVFLSVRLNVIKWFLASRSSVCMFKKGFTYIIKSHCGINKLSQVDTLIKLIQLLENWIEAQDDFSWQFHGFYFILTDLIVAITV